MIPRGDLVQIVSEDLQYLREEWNQDVDDATLRRESTVLRRLLLQNELQRAWRMVGLTSQPIIRTPALGLELKMFPLKDIELAAAGGATYKQVHIERTLIFSRTLSEQDFDSLAKAGSSEIDIKLTEFINTACMVVRGHMVSRQMLIKYVANKLGGAHYDTMRDQSERLFQLLDDHAFSYFIADKPSIYFELLSIGQALLKSGDIDRFLTKARSLDYRCIKAE